MRPIGIDEEGTILFGNGCFAASKYLGLELVPTLTLSGLSPSMKAAIVIADNKTAENSAWDFEVLKGEISNLINGDFPLELTGFSVGEIDLMLKIDAEVGETTNDAVDLSAASGPAVSAVGGVWDLGRNKIICADARDAELYRTLLGSDLAQMVVTDAPYNVPIQGHARGRGRKKQREFVMASGEMTSPAFTGFLESVMSRAVQFSSQASIHYWFMDCLLHDALPRPCIRQACSGVAGLRVRGHSFSQAARNQAGNGGKFI